MSTDHAQHDTADPIPIPRRPLTDRERGWIAEILASNQLWADVTIGELFATAKCRCGCGSVIIERPATPQNPRLAGKHGDVGTMYIRTADRGLITVMLYQDDGYLTVLSVVYDDYEKGFQPLPESWNETQRIVESG